MPPTILISGIGNRGGTPHGILFLSAAAGIVITEPVRTGASEDWFGISLLVIQTIEFVGGIGVVVVVIIDFMVVVDVMDVVVVLARVIGFFVGFNLETSSM